MTNLYAALWRGFPADLGRIAIETADTAPARLYTWRDLDRASSRIANWLDSLALAPRSRIVAQTGKSVEAVMLYLAVLRAGHVHVPLNTAYQAAEMAYFVADAEPAVVVCAPRQLDAMRDLVAKSAGDHGLACPHVVSLGDDITGTLLDSAAPFPDTHRVAAAAADDLAVIVYTSGTTGRSKGAMLSHGNLLSNARTLRSFWDWKPDDVLLHALPIFHVHGLFVALHGALLNGSRIVWFSKFDARDVVAQLRDATVFMGVPTLYVRMLAEPTLDRAACARMRLFISGSAPLLVETFDAWTARTGHVILERYGMSETVMLTSNPCRPERGERRRGTVGPALPEVAVRTVDAATGTPCACDETGSVEVRGPNVFAGYWRMPGKTKDEFTADGWFRTGDVGRLSDDGYLTIVGRSKDLVITGGYNVYPAEVEGFLNEMPGVAESAVIGVPHPDFGEGVVAVIVARPGAKVDGATLIAALKSHIAAFKVPKHVEVVGELPRNAMGKVQKNVLRERHAAAFGPARR